jgi:hypothetical protein
MTNSDWRARVMQARTERDDLRPKRVWVLHRDGREPAIDVKAVPGLGAEIVLTVDGQWRKTRLFRSHEQAELVGAIADTRMMLEGKAGRDGEDDDATQANRQGRVSRPLQPVSNGEGRNRRGGAAA